MSKAVELIKEGASSAGRKLEGASKGDIGDLTSVLTLGSSDRGEWLAGKAMEPLERLFKAPDPLPPPGLSQANVAESAPSVDITGTESSRRTSGRAVGTRKLRIPLGGLQ